MKKVVFFLLFLLIIPLYANAEISTNLNVKKYMVKGSKTQIDRETYEDADGNIVVPSDKGYATIKILKIILVIIVNNFFNCIDNIL